jgi:hypothetical protein
LVSCYPGCYPGADLAKNAVFRTTTKSLKTRGDPGWIRTSDPQLRRLTL